MIIHTENIGQVKAICDHFSIPINVVEVEITFPYALELKELNGQKVENTDEYTFDQFDVLRSLKFTYHLGINMEAGAERQYKATWEGRDVYRVMWTPKNRKSGNWGKGKSVFCLDTPKDKEATDDFKKFLDRLIGIKLKVV